MIGPGVEVDNSGLLTWLNDAYLYMVDEISKNNPDFFTKTATDSTVSGTQEYDLPTDFDKMIMVNLKIDGTWYRALPLPTINNIPVHSRTDSSQGFSTTEPYYYIVGDKYGFMPIPSESTASAIKLWYVYTPSELSADSDEPAFSKKFHHIIKYGAYANYLDQDDEHVAAENMRRRFEKRVSDMVESMNENQVDEPRSVVITNSSDIYYDDEGYVEVCMRNEKGQFIKGNIPWHKGKYATKECERCRVVFTPRPGRAKYVRFCTRSCAKKGNTNWKKNLMNPEAQEKSRLAKIGKPRPDMKGKRYALGHTAWNKGKKFEAIKGEKNPNWKGGVTPRDLIERAMFRKTIQKEVLKRDDYTCRMCGVRGKEMQVDHIQPWAEYVELRFKMENCRTLCKPCHYQITFGRPIPNKSLSWGRNFGRRDSL